MPGFVVVIQGGSGASRDRVTLALKQSGVAWWHIIENIWFVTGVDPSVDCNRFIAWLRTKLGEEARWIVVKADGSGEWAGYGPPEWFDWFEKQWHGDPFSKILG